MFCYLPLQIQDEEITLENVEEVAEEAANITASNMELTSDGIDTVATILEEITEVQSTEVEVKHSRP